MNPSNQILFIVSFPVIVLFGFFYYKKYYKDHEEVYATLMGVITFGVIKPKTSSRIFLGQNILIGFVFLGLYIYNLYSFLLSPK
jgi:hypothetical protein